MKCTAGIDPKGNYFFLRSASPKGRLCEARRERPPFFFKAGGDPEGMARPRSTDRSGRAYIKRALNISARVKKKKLSLCKGKLKKYVYG